MPEDPLEDKLIAVPASVGGAWYCEDESREALIDRADRGLYVSKQEGRDRVTWEDRGTGGRGFL